MTATSAYQTVNTPQIESIQETLDCAVNELIASLPDPERLSAEERRGIIARYSSVLEGNFIYWMTATLLSVESEEVREIILENLHEEVRDSHPHMLRKFEIAAHAVPTDVDAESVYSELTAVRLFLGRLLGVQNVVTMAFFEGWIQRFMAFLGKLAEMQGSTEMEYTDVHGVCDVTHTRELFRALEIEMALRPPDPDSDLYEGMHLLRTLVERMLRPTETALAS